jgi:hypothetical protein
MSLESTVTEIDNNHESDKKGEADTLIAKHNVIFDILCRKVMGNTLDEFDKDDILSPSTGNLNIDGFKLEEPESNTIDQFKLDKPESNTIESTSLDVNIDVIKKQQQEEDDDIELCAQCENIAKWFEKETDIPFCSIECQQKVRQPEGYVCLISMKESIMNDVSSIDYNIDLYNHNNIHIIIQMIRPSSSSALEYMRRLKYDEETTDDLKIERHEKELRIIRAEQGLGKIILYDIDKERRKIFYISSKKGDQIIIPRMTYYSISNHSDTTLKLSIICIT